MEHKLIYAGGWQYLPFARSRIKALRAAGLRYASQNFIVGDATVRVRISNQHDFISITAGVALFAIGTEDNHLVVRWKASDDYGDWTEHSRFEHAYVHNLDLVPNIRVGRARNASISPRSTDTPGSNSGSTTYRFIDYFGVSRKLAAGPEAPYLAGGFWTLIAWVITTDAENNAFLLRAEQLDVGTFPGGTFQKIAWRCDRVAFGANTLTAMPAMYTFNSYNPSAHSGRGLKLLMTENVVYLGDGKWAYGMGGSSRNDGTRDADHKMALVVTDGFDTHTGYDVEAGLGGTFGPDDFAMGGIAYMGSGRCLVGGYGTHNMIDFDTTTGAMVSRTSPTDSGWGTTKAVPMPMGADSACYWRAVSISGPENSIAEFVYTTDRGVTWTARTIACEDRNGDPLTIEYYLGTTTVRHPVVKDSGGTVTSTGELIAIFYVPGEGHVEFRTTDLGTTWRHNGVISPIPADPSSLGLMFRHVCVNDPGLSLVWS
jgi:hypothetical protein